MSATELVHAEGQEGVREHLEWTAFPLAFDSFLALLLTFLQIKDKDRGD